MSRINGKNKNRTPEEKVAIKILCKYNMSVADLEHVKTEIETMKIANHPNIIKLYDVFENEKMIYIIMEYCEGGDLGQLIKRCKKNKDYIAEDVIWKIFDIISVHSPIKLSISYNLFFLKEAIFS